jgi:hypothetical protein
VKHVPQIKLSPDQRVKRHILKFRELFHSFAVCIIHKMETMTRSFSLTSLNPNKSPPSREEFINIDKVAEFVPAQNSANVSHQEQSTEVASLPLAHPRACLFVANLLASIDDISLTKGIWNLFKNYGILRDGKLF